MKLITTGICILVAATTLAAQTDRKSGPIVAVGCINRAQHDGSLAGSPGVPPASPSTAPALANSNEPTNAYLLNGATIPGADDETRVKATTGQATAPPATLTSYVLDGARGELEQHVGHRVEVTGTLRVVTEGPEPSSRKEVRHIQVTTVRMLADSCQTSAQLR
jgi:hypothetical protein